MLKPVLASFDDHQLIAFDMERLDDGRAALLRAAAWPATARRQGAA